MDNPTKRLTAFDTSAGGDWPSGLAGHTEKTERVSLAPYVMLLLALMGIADAFYVAHASYSGQPMWCPIVDGCNTVAQSPYARIFGVPLSYFGLAFYLSMFGLATLLAFDPLSRGLRFGTLLYTAIGVSYSVYGMYLQLSQIRAVCSYCMISAVTTVLLFIAAFRHFRATRIRAITGSNAGVAGNRS